MASGFPGSIDNFTDPLTTSALNSPSHAGQHQDLNDAVEKIETYMGLVKVKPTSVTNGTLSADGTVTIGNAVSVVSIFGAFSSLYRNYRVVWSVTSQSATANCLMYMDASASGTYYTSGMYMSPSSATITGYQFSAQNTAVVGVWQSGFANATGAFDIQSPQLANRTFIQSQSGAPGYFWWGGSQIADTAQNVNLYFACSAGTMTGGSVVVYGYRN